MRLSKAAARVKTGYEGQELLKVRIEAAADEQRIDYRSLGD